MSHLRDSKLFTTSNSSLELSTEDRSSYYARKYPRLAKLEEVCSQIEKESELEFRNRVNTRKRVNITVQDSNSSDTLLSDSSTITASESGYDAEDSMSFTIQTINDLLDHQIDDSVSKSDSFQDSLIHESSLSSTQTSYMELKEILQTFSISVQKLEIFSDDSLFFQLQSRFMRALIKLPEDFQIKLRTILEESDENSHSSVDFFKSLLLHAMDNTQSIHDERAISSHTALRPLKLAKASVSPGSQSQSLHPDSGSESTELKSSDLNELSFTTIEKLCMQDELPQTPKPMPGLTEEQKKSLELCRKQELELLSESPYSSQSSGSKRCVDSRDGGIRKARSLVDSKDRGPASSSLTSSSDWDIRKEVLHADLHQSWMEFSSKKEQENKARKSYADEFMQMVNKHFEQSDKSKSPSGLKESSVQAVTVGSKNFKASKLSSKSSMGMKKRDGSKRKITTGFIKKRSLIPIRKSGVSKSATMSKAKVSCMFDMIYSTSEESRIPAGEEIVSGTLPNLLDKSTSSLLTPNWTGRSGNSESLSSGCFNPGPHIPMISITCPSPNTNVIKSPFNTSPGPKNYEKFQRKYFCTPGRKPAPKKKRIFFPTPEKNIFPKTPEIEKTPGYICSKPIESKVKSPVGAYIRGVLSASAIADPDRVREFLAK